jgi:hypothetical protein
MRSPNEISVGNGWYWLAGVILALVGWWSYLAIIRPVLPVLAWHRTHSRTLQFAEFHLDVPLFWYVTQADFQQPDDISIDKAILPGRGYSSITLLRPPSSARTDGTEPGAIWPMRDEEWRGDEQTWAKIFGASSTTRMTYRLADGSMDCLYKKAESFVTMSCFNKKTGSSLEFIGTKRDYSKLHDIVR